MGALINTISRIEAVKRVQNWLKYATEKLGFKPEDTPKSVFIPRADIDDALHEFERFDAQDRKASGVRIYFTKKFPMGDSNDDLRLSCIVVPTVMSNLKDTNTGKPIHNDAIIKIPADRKRGSATTRVVGGGNAGDGDDTESIYDFTSPCPTDCGGTTDW
jgi:hypothetical protein